MSDAIEARNDWVRRVLGVTLPEGAAARQGSATAGTRPTRAAARAQDWAAVRATWQAASDAVDAQIAALQAALRADGDDTLKQIAEFGMNGLTGNYKVPLMVALAELDGGDPAIVARTGPKLLGTVQAFRSFLDGDEKIAVCDENPFGVPVAIRATLGGALAQMAAMLAAPATP
ncbi:MAG: hypothetical protein ACREFY_17240 [Acetobacteraceae bacterium]